MAENHEVLKNDGSLNVPLYVKTENQFNNIDTTKVYQEWKNLSLDLKVSINELLK